MHLSSRTGGPWVAAGQQTGAGGSAERRYRKELIRVGSYVKVEDGIEFEVTHRTLRHWIGEFARMKANGVRVPIPNGHHNAGNADQNRGYVEALIVDGDALYMECRLIGRDAIQAAERADVSIFVPPQLVDGKGNVYVQPIEHVALCTDPVVPGLGEFVPLAASRAKERAAGTEPAIVRDAKRRAVAAELEALRRLGG